LRYGWDEILLLSSKYLPRSVKFQELNLRRENTVSHRLTSLSLLALTLLVLVGCRRGGPPPAPQAPATKKADTKTGPEPKVELPKIDEPTKLTIQEPVRQSPTPAAPEPWVVGEWPQPKEAQPVVVHLVPQFGVTGLSVRPLIGRGIVTVKTETKAPKGGKALPAGTRVVNCDLREGKVLSEWVVDGTQSVLDLSPDGRMILACSPSGKDRSTLRLWLIGSEGQLQRWEWTPHTAPAGGAIRTASGRTLTEAESMYVKWAAFVGSDRIVSASEGGQVRVYNTEGPKLLATIDATPCRPAVTPDGSRVAFLAGENVALLDVAGARVASTRYLGPPPNYPVFAFSPDGTRLAVGGNGKLLLMDMKTAAVEHSVLPRLRVNDNGTVDKPFGWLGKEFLYADQQVHDPKFPLPIWTYRGAEQIEFAGEQVWAVTRAPGSPSTTLLPFTLPQPGILEKVAAEKEKPGLFTLKKGDGIKIDVNAVPADRQGEVRSQLEARLQAAGYAVNPDAPATLVASIDTAGSPNTMHYAGQKPIVYQRKPAKLQIFLSGRELWSEAWSVPPPFTLQVPAGTPPAEALAKTGAGEPNYELFAKAPIPPYFPGPNAPPESFGISDLTPGGVKDR
jgi:hypothetical protein